jgi:hypothetical protein
MNRAETYFQDLAPLSHAGPVGMTHEGVTPVHMAWLMGQTRVLVPTWRDIGLSRAKRTGMTQSRWLLWRDWWAICYVMRGC